MKENIYGLVTVFCNSMGLEFNKHYPVEIGEKFTIEETISNVLNVAFDSPIMQEHDYFEVTYENEVTAKADFKQISRADYIALSRYL